MEIINPLTYSGWDERLRQSGGGSVFHTSGWASVLTESYGFRPNYFATVESGRFLFLLPVMEVNNPFAGKKGISLPFTDYCNPIIGEGIRFSELFPQLTEVADSSHWHSFQIRVSGDTIAPLPPFSRYYRHYLSLLEKEEVIFRNFRENYRRKIKKATDNKIGVTISESFDSVEQYYRLHCLTRKRLGVPPQPFYYFQAIFKHIIGRDLGRIVLASAGEKVIAGAVFFYHGGRAIYKYGASDIRYEHLFPNYLLFWEAIRWLCETGKSELCFGRTEPGHTGLIQFKEGWNAQKEEIYYYKYDLRNKTYVKGDNDTKIPAYPLLKLLPVPLLKFLGSLVYRFGA